MKRALPLLTALLALCLWTSVSTAAEVIIDDFTAGNTDLLLDEGDSPFPATTMAEDADVAIRGGTRRATIAHHGFTTGTEGDVLMDQDTGADTMNLSSDSNSKGKWMLEYGETWNGGTDLGDLTDGGNIDAIVLEVISADAGITVDMSALDNDSDSDTVSKTIATAITSPTSLIFLFSEFSSSVDFNDMDSLRFFIDGTSTPALDFTLDIIGSRSSQEIIPEPVTLSLVGLGGLVLLRRRRK